MLIKSSGLPKYTNVKLRSELTCLSSLMKAKSGTVEHLVDKVIIKIDLDLSLLGTR